MKGKYGIRLAVYGVLAFILAYLGSTTLLFLLLGVVLLAEKNEWATRQVLQAVVLYFTATLLKNVIGLFDFMYNIAFISVVWGVIVKVIYAIIKYGVLILVLDSIIKNLKDQDAELPLLNKVVDWMYGVVKEKVKPEAAPAAQAPVAEAPVTEAPAENNAE